MFDRNYSFATNESFFALKLLANYQPGRSRRPGGCRASCSSGRLCWRWRWRPIVSITPKTAASWFIWGHATTSNLKAHSAILK